MSKCLVSICIPCYNSNVVEMCSELSKQIVDNNLSFEIVIIDDCSNKSFKEQNLPIKQIGGIDYIELQQNVGRSKIRNLFLSKTRGDYLLFIDGDSSIPANYLIKYNDFLQENHNIKVVVGASIYQAQKPPLNRRLRWKYSTRRESLDYRNRIKNPKEGFKSNNFLICRKVFEKNKFDETLSGYGHEDTLFGFILYKNSISVAHIDNPVINSKLDTNKDYLIKTENAVKNLLIISQRMKFSSDWLENQKLMRKYLHLRMTIPGKMFLFFCGLEHWFYKQFLHTGLAPLYIFDLYRINLLHRYYKLRK